MLWYYADLEKEKCLDDMSQRRDTLEGLMHGRRSNKVVKIIFSASLSSASITAKHFSAVKNLDEVTHFIISFDAEPCIST